MRLRTALLFGAAGVITTASAATAWLLRDPRPWFDARRSRIAVVEEQPAVVTGTNRVQAVRVVGASGLVVDLTWKRAVADGSRRLPLAMILGGHVTGAQAASKVGDTPGVMVAAISYPYSGDLRPSRTTFLRQIPAIRRAFLDTPPALLLAHDYLRTRADVDTARVEALGVSLGAPFVTIAGAMDSRLSRVWVLHGSGGSFAPLEKSMRRSIGFAPLRVFAAVVANVIIAGPRLAPERWVASIAPRPFVMVNADNDELLPRASVESLFERAQQPKEMIWMPGKHIHGDTETIQRLVAIVLARVRGNENAVGFSTDGVR